MSAQIVRAFDAQRCHDRAHRSTVRAALRNRDSFETRLQMAGIDTRGLEERGLWDALTHSGAVQDPRETVAALFALSGDGIDVRVRCAAELWAEPLPAAAIRALFVGGAQALLQAGRVHDREGLQHAVKVGFSSSALLDAHAEAAKEMGSVAWAMQDEHVVRWWEAATAQAPPAGPVLRSYRVELPLGEPVNRRVVLRGPWAAVRNPLRALSSCPRVVRVRGRQARPGGSGDDLVLRLVFLAHSELQLTARVTVVDDDGGAVAAVEFVVNATNVPALPAGHRVDAAPRLLFVQKYT